MGEALHSKNCAPILTAGVLAGVRPIEQALTLAAEGSAVPARTPAVNSLSELPPVAHPPTPPPAPLKRRGR